MKKIVRYAGLSALILVSVLSGQAQQKLQVRLGYNINTPLGSFKNTVSNTSFRGFSGEVLYPINESFSVGLGTSFNDFYQKYPRQVYATSEGHISAVLSNSIQTTPLLVKANYGLIQTGFIRPYVGIGAGVNFINYNQYLGEFPNSKVAIRPALTGGAGINIPLGETKKAGLNLGANYNYMPFNYNEVKNLNNWGVHAGVFFQLR